ncbi:MAG: hypothetical protein WKF77_21240 [Planctomycetaceae bacterium]
MAELLAADSLEQQKGDTMQQGIPAFDHPRVARRTAVQAGGISLLGLGMNHLAALRAAAAESTTQQSPIRSCIYIFLSGGLSQHDSFDPKPHAPAEIRGEFSPISRGLPECRSANTCPVSLSEVTCGRCAVR